MVLSLASPFIILQKSFPLLVCKVVFELINYFSDLSNFLTSSAPRLSNCSGFSSQREMRLSKKYLKSKTYNNFTASKMSGVRLGIKYLNYWCFHGRSAKPISPSKEMQAIQFNDACRIYVCWGSSENDLSACSRFSGFMEYASSHAESPTKIRFPSEKFLIISAS